MSNESKTCLCHKHMPIDSLVKNENICIVKCLVTILLSVQLGSCVYLQRKPKEIFIRSRKIWKF